MELSVISQQIRDSYWKHQELLPPFKQAHFFRRAWRATGGARYASFMKSMPRKHLVPITGKPYKAIAMAIQDRDSTRIPSGMAKKSPRKKKRYQGYSKQPELYFFDRLIYNMSTAQYLELDKLRPRKYERLKSLLSDIDFRNVYVNRAAVLDVGCTTVNTVLFLEQLDITDIRDSYIDLMISLHFEFERSIARNYTSKWDYYTFLYNLTHLIIADSRFYQRHVVDYLWVTKYFAENADEIIEKAGMDLLAEVALCIKLTREHEKYSVALSEITRALYNEYIRRHMLTPDTLLGREHTNAVLMLAWADNTDWFPGPSLFP